jgi:hypothetical protein
MIQFANPVTLGEQDPKQSMRVRSRGRLAVRRRTDNC